MRRGHGPSALLPDSATRSIYVDQMMESRQDRCPSRRSRKVRSMTVSLPPRACRLRRVDALPARFPRTNRAMLRRHIGDVVAVRFAGAGCAEGRAVAAVSPPGPGRIRLPGRGARAADRGRRRPSALGHDGRLGRGACRLALADAEPCGCGGSRTRFSSGSRWSYVWHSGRRGACLRRGIWPTRSARRLERRQPRAACRDFPRRLPAMRCRSPRC